MSMDIDNIVYGAEPREWADSWRKGVGKTMFVRAVRCGLIEDFMLNCPPPMNSSITTFKELVQVKHMTESITEEQVFLCDQLDKDLHAFFSKVCLKMGLFNETPEVLESITKPYLGIISFIKLMFNRPRPWQLAPYLGMAIHPPIQVATGNSASYPSGHTYEFLILIDYLASKYPEKSNVFRDLYGKIRSVRLLTGIHYPSDIVGGETLVLYLKKYGLL
jgi:hypothetical protein